ncbi:Allophanate hydrolase 2 subunit 1 [Salmonella enterica subsp. enterica]|nr:Allophanate hydrolase 2 subunit 1 [Salmonella enterica subsp. enterica]
MQRARCYLLGETAVVLELEPPITLASQKRIWRLTQRLVDMPNVVEAIPGMNNITVILREPQTLALDAIERLQRWWEESEALEPDSRSVEIPVIYGGAGGPDLAAVARHSGLSEKQVVELHASVEYVVWFVGFQPGFPYLGNLPEPLHMPRRAEPRLQVPAGSVGIGGAQTGDLSIIHAGRLAADRPHAVEVIRSDAGASGFCYALAIAYALCRKRREYAEYYSRGDLHLRAG